MGMVSMISSALGGFTSNIMSIATADRRAKQVKQQYETQARLAEYNRQLAQNQAEEMRQMQQHQIAMADYERALARNADIEAKNADIEAENQRKKTHRKAIESFGYTTALQEKKLAIMAKSGVTSAGTPILVQQEAVSDAITKQNDILWKGQEDLYNIAQKKYQINMKGQQYRMQGHNYDLSAWNYGNKATVYDSQARIAQYQADVSRSIGKYRSKMIKFQKNLTIAKMFYDPSNVSSFGEVDNQSQFQHFNTGTLSSIGSFGGGGKSAISNGYSNSSFSTTPQSSGSSLLINKGGTRYA